jgi:hypothetical protein
VKDIYVRLVVLLLLSLADEPVEELTLVSTCGGSDYEEGTFVIRRPLMVIEPAPEGDNSLKVYAVPADATLDVSLEEDSVSGLIVSYNMFQNPPEGTGIIIQVPKDNSIFPTIHVEAHQSLVNINPGFTNIRRLHVTGIGSE